VLEIVDLHSGYGRMEVLHGISLNVGGEEIVSVIGSNGAGKSTTLRTISGLLAFRQGQIRFNGATLHGRPVDIVKSGISHVPEGRRLFSDMTVHENLLLGAYTCGSAELAERLERVYELFPLMRERSRQHAGSLSGGEQQMVAIGRGIMAKPQLLMLDEPSMGLAPKLVSQLADIIRAVRSLGISVLLVEQNSRLALDIADRVYVLQMGAIVAQGAAIDLRGDPFVRRAYLGH
jgi:branched-chain amino acid transport system ATP-binding protein